jgi:hypothetical protein
MSWLDNIWDAARNLFSPTPPASPVSRCPAGAITPQRAQEVFDKLKARKDIPFDYPPDCCYARASVMCDAMKDMGIPCRKVWTSGELVPMKPDGAPVRFPPKPSGTQVTWGYHVAPVVDVAQPDGSCVPMVMDPSLSDRPLTVAQWNAVMSGPGSRIDKTVFTDPNVFYGPPEHPAYYETSAVNRTTAIKGHVASRDAELKP